MEAHQGVLPGGDGLELGSLRVYWGGTDGGQAGRISQMRQDKRYRRVGSTPYNQGQQGQQEAGSLSAARQGLASQGEDLELSIQQWSAMARAQPDRN